MRPKHRGDADTNFARFGPYDVVPHRHWHRSARANDPVPHRVSEVDDDGIPRETLDAHYQPRLRWRALRTLKHGRQRYADRLITASQNQAGVNGRSIRARILPSNRFPRFQIPCGPGDKLPTGQTAAFHSVFRVRGGPFGNLQHPPACYSEREIGRTGRLHHSGLSLRERVGSAFDRPQATSMVRRTHSPGGATAQPLGILPRKRRSAPVRSKINGNGRCPIPCHKTRRRSFEQSSMRSSIRIHADQDAMGSSPFDPTCTQVIAIGLGSTVYLSWIGQNAARLDLILGVIGILNLISNITFFRLRETSGLCGTRAAHLISHESSGTSGSDVAWLQKNRSIST